MKIKHVIIEGLFGRNDPIILDFEDDLNILTGKNGAGKTNVLKLIWYIISGNIDEAISEVKFRSISIVTSEYYCKVNMLDINMCNIEFQKNNEEMEFYQDYEDENHSAFAEDMGNQVIKKIGGSVFLPTFRRIEGGFTLENARRNYTHPFGKNIKNEIEEGLDKLSKNLTNNSHLFVASISSVDITNLLLKQYTDLSERSNTVQKERSDTIIKKIRQFDEVKFSINQLESATNLISEIRSDVLAMETERSKVMNPLLEVQKVVERIFKKSGIEFDKKITFGDAATAIKSNLLSAGEKQMLSFICYNAFYNDTIFFIDEPELSLHVDWQRTLFITLMRQNPSNQFIISTHSPFIYSKYPEKEVCIDTKLDKGNSEKLEEHR